MDKRRLFPFSGNKGRHFLVFLICVGIAFFMWLVHRLSLDYSSYFRYELILESPLPGHAAEASAQELLLVKGKASGFYIVKYRAASKAPRLTVQATQRELRPYGTQTDAFVLSAQILRERLAEQFEGDVELENILTDSLHFVLPKVATKKCKVVFNGSCSYQSQYTSFDPVKLIPDSIVVSGLESDLKRIDSVLTTPVLLKNLDRDTQGVRGIVAEEGLHYETKEVRFEISVQRFIERRIKREIKLSDVPAGTKVLTIPTELTIQFRLPYDEADRPDDHLFVPVVRFMDLEESISGKIIPVLTELPRRVQHIVLDPPFVECIIQKTN